LRLAQFTCLHQTLHLKPLLLLDDVFDKLDEQRISRLIALMAEQHFGQVWITDARGTRSAMLLKRLPADKALFRIDQGRLVESNRLA